MVRDLSGRKVPIIDEVGVWPYDCLAATALFTLISARYERGSVILTSNKGFELPVDLLAARRKLRPVREGMK